MLYVLDGETNDSLYMSHLLKAYDLRKILNKKTLIGSAKNEIESIYSV